MRIEQIISIGGYVLVVYYTSSRCYQTEVLTAFRILHQSQSIFYQAAAAEAEGRRLINELSLLSRCDRTTLSPNAASLAPVVDTATALTPHFASRR